MFRNIQIVLLMKYGLSLMLSLSVLSVLPAFSQSLSPQEIVEKAYYNERSDAANLTMTIEVIRPSSESGTRGQNLGNGT